MEKTTYLDWLATKTQTTWWHDSADADELDLALQHGATGVTTNPVLNNQALRAGGALKFPELSQSDWKSMSTAERSEWLTSLVVRKAARTMEPEYRRSGGADGYVCAQVNPALAGNREAMLAMARKFAAIGPNIAVKLPATAAGLDILGQCVAEGITCTATVSFTVAQTLAAAESHRRGSLTAKKNGVKPGRCFAVIMIGRQDDYLREMIEDARTNIAEDAIRQAGIAIAKRAYRLMKAGGYEARLCVAALRGIYHMTELAGADLTMSIHPRYQQMLYKPGLPCEERIDQDVPAEVIDRLMASPEFVRAYEPDRLPVDEFMAYGLTQRTLSQFCEVGWNPLAAIGA